MGSVKAALDRVRYGFIEKAGRVQAFLLEENTSSVDVPDWWIEAVDDGRVYFDHDEDRYYLKAVPSNERVEWGSWIKRCDEGYLTANTPLDFHNRYERYEG